MICLSDSITKYVREIRKRAYRDFSNDVITKEVLDEIIEITENLKKAKDKIKDNN